MQVASWETSVVGIEALKAFWGLLVGDVEMGMEGNYSAGDLVDVRGGILSWVYEAGIIELSLRGKN